MYRQGTLNMGRSPLKHSAYLLISTGMRGNHLSLGKNHLKGLKMVTSDTYVPSKIVPISASHTGKPQDSWGSESSTQRVLASVEGTISLEPLQSCLTNIKNETWNNRMAFRQLNFIPEKKLKSIQQKTKISSTQSDKIHNV